MYCSNCGKEINSSDSFCPNCGTKVNSDQIYMGENKSKSENKKIFNSPIIHIILL